MRTTSDEGRTRIRRHWWHKVAAVVVALLVPGGLVSLLYLVVRSRTRAKSAMRDPYVEWLRMRDQVRSEWQPAKPSDSVLPRPRA
jgi:hypothetical protein